MSPIAAYRPLILAARKITRKVGGVLLLGAAALSPPAASAETFPARPIRIIVPFAAGGSTDALARVIAQQLGGPLGQTVTVDNRPGAAGAIGADAVAKATADGYTLLMATSSTHAVLPHLRKLPYDPIRDFTPVAGIGTAPNVLVASPTLGVSDMAQFLKAMKAKDGRPSFSSSGSGTITHLIGESFAQAAGIKATHVPYKTGVQALPDIASGQVDFAFDSIVWTLSQAKAGRVNALAISSTRRSALAPDLPTVAESGFPGFEGTTWFGLMGPRNLSTAIVDELNTKISRILASADVKALLEAQGAEPMPGSSESFAQMIQADSQRWARVISSADIKLND